MDPIITGSLIAGGAQVANGLIDQVFAEHNRKRNFYWNEKAADAADQRQRAQYNDLYSPQAMLDQYEAAGLSPSMMMSGGQSATGSSSAQGNMSAGIQGPYPSGIQIDPMAAAQIANLNADTKGKELDADKKALENKIQKLNALTFENEWNLINGNYGGKITYNANGTIKSLTDWINESNDYDAFRKNIQQYYGAEGDTWITSQEGEKTLRNIYEQQKTFSNEIAVLANSEENAKLMLDITNVLENQNFAKESANAQIQQLKQINESADLTTKQKGAMNRLIDKMGQSTAADIALVLLLMLGQYSHANLNLGASQVTSIKKE